MKTRFIILTMVSLAIIIWAFPGLSNDSKIDQQKSFYLQSISNEIESYSCKADFTSSRSKNLRAYGERASMRAAFLSRNRDSLAQEMVLKQVSMRPHSVHQYLLHRCDQEFASTKAKKKK